MNGVYTSALRKERYPALSCEVTKLFTINLSNEQI